MSRTELDERAVEAATDTLKRELFKAGRSDVEVPYSSMALATVRAYLSALSPSPAEQTREVVPDATIATIWTAAMTVACNVVVQRQNDLNADDGPMAVLNEQGAIISALKTWLSPDSVYLEEVRRLLPGPLYASPPAAERQGVLEAQAEQFAIQAGHEAAAMKARIEQLEAALRVIDKTLTIPAAEYVPAIGDVFTIIEEALK